MVHIKKKKKIPLQLHVGLGMKPKALTTIFKTPYKLAQPTCLTSSLFSLSLPSCTVLSDPSTCRFSLQFTDAIFSNWNAVPMSPVCWVTSVMRAGTLYSSPWLHPQGQKESPACSRY